MLTESNAVWQPHPPPQLRLQFRPPLQLVYNYLTKNMCLCNLQQDMLSARPWPQKGRTAANSSKNRCLVAANAVICAFCGLGIISIISKKFTINSISSKLRAKTRQPLELINWINPVS